MIDMLDKGIINGTNLTLMARYSPKVLENYKENLLPEILKKYADKIDSEWNKVVEEYKKIEFKRTNIYFFTSFVPYDFRIGSTFNSIFSKDEPYVKFKCESVIMAILDEWTLIPVESVPCGHRCICMVDFPKGIPIIINRMQEVEKVTSSNQDSEIYLYNL